MKTLIKSTADIGAAIRHKRKKDGLKLTDTAGLCNVGYRFLSDIENGKPTARLGMVLQVINALGLEIELKERTWSDA
ncbi:MAG: helix-turn-helix domain-containing protein [Deltaproteobacteria bacterium]